ncbi:hypothetical protein KFL_000270360 [Klebsormidium nitens]|uniref:Uncharacterized protein n=1 Tax=Klebsormidium nitens TaxID=105231 RepID=A0A1Y1HRT1_KLENI|nr:hypothetical protein KFL_000270360 [Klebsormidium nitens]|eukprot:GAQ79277.1 hypothetical protein KFL_000270360 [Klebsormidium nitens]
MMAVAEDRDAPRGELTLQEYFDSLAKTQTPASVISDKVAAETLKQEREASRAEAPKTSSPTRAESRAESSRPQEGEAAPNVLQEGFLRLTQAADWVVGVGEPPTTAPLEEVQFEYQSPEERKQEAQAAYDALKKELLLMTGAIAAAVDLYIFFAFDIENTVSYAVGVAGSFAYLALLMRYADSVERKDVSEVFRQRRSRSRQTRGVTSRGVSAFAEKLASGVRQPWSSARLLPFAGLILVFAQWNALAAEPTGFHLKFAPLILGSFAYKAACLLIAYRDNQKLRTNMTWEQVGDADDSDDDIDFSDLPPF